MTPPNTILEFLAKRKLPAITLAQLCADTGIERLPAKRVLMGLEKEGLLHRKADGKQPLEAGQSGPKPLNPKWTRGKRKPYKDRIGGKTKPGPLRDKLWKLIRMRQTFNINDLVTIAGVEEATARNYIKLLKQHGHIKKTGRTREGVTWHLIMKSPPVKRPNLSEKINEDEETR